MITGIPTLKDNYIWAIIHDKDVVIVDPGEAQPVLDFLKQNNYVLTAILITHKHWDHCNGVIDITTQYPVPVYGPTSNAIAGLTHPLQDNEEINFPEHNLSFKTLAIPGHTLEHIAFYSPGILFSGDTLFTGGCGKVFEGTPSQMCNSLDKLSNLPDDTLVYCGHEYTEANLRFALMVDPANVRLQERQNLVIQLRAKNLPTVPATLALEKSTNPFLRCDAPEIVQAVSLHAKTHLTERVAVFTHLRQWKNTI